MIAVCIGVCALLILILRFMLDRENKRREAEKAEDSYDDVYLAQEKQDGTKAEKHVDRVGILFCQVPAFHYAMDLLEWLS